MSTYLARIKIMLHKEILDVQGKAVEKALHSLQFQQINNVRIGKYVELEIAAKSAEDAKTQVDDACEKLIANPIIEHYEVRIEKK
ncbi:MAG: phosphoribosylformylglycinamidine synthase subunit PurS [Ignavibacteria bacterium]|nr:phosphoribosylformylglycinamidine synthase subunit PurS [Ignavibacteria bacterium]